MPDQDRNIEDQLNKEDDVEGHRHLGGGQVKEDDVEGHRHLGGGQ
ncbi:MAG: hypothetical protein QOD46_420 [Actinomycetota bacterium]|nr:hypothetical protein [Actinomycetota bacterium]